ncbi:MAG: class I SAM-dependent methyltransferase [Candidatus Altiarchaeota archaeon]
MNVPEGVMDDSYARERKLKKSLIFRYKVRANVVAEASRRFLEPGKPIRVLDFGSADGLTLIELGRLLPDATFLGIEYSESLLRCVPKLPENMRIVRGDITSLPNEAGGGYDLVSALAVLEHLDDPKKAVMEAARVLRPGGIFVATCPNPFWEGLSSRMGLLKGDHHTTELDLKRMEEIAVGCGLEVVSRERFMLAAVTFLPYLGIQVSPSGSLGIDRAASRLRMLDWLFTNQLIIARKTT